jgi:hypothetical protein
MDIAPSKEIKKMILKELMMHFVLRYFSKITALIFGAEILKKIGLT